jgi:hypothetical protein
MTVNINIYIIISLIRLEFDDRNQEYYSEFDAVELFGYTNEYYFESKRISDGLKEICLKYKDFFKKNSDAQENVDHERTNSAQETKVDTQANSVSLSLTNLPVFCH